MTAPHFNARSNQLSDRIEVHGGPAEREHGLEEVVLALLSEYGQALDGSIKRYRWAVGNCIIGPVMIGGLILLYALDRHASAKNTWMMVAGLAVFLVVSVIVCRMWRNADFRRLLGLLYRMDRNALRASFEDHGLHGRWYVDAAVAHVDRITDELSDGSPLRPGTVWVQDWKLEKPKDWSVLRNKARKAQRELQRQT